MNGLGLIGMMISLALVGLLTLKQKKATHKALSKQLEAFDQDEAPQEIDANLKKLRNDPEAVKKEMEEQLQKRMQAIEHSTAIDN